jgi:hypothetical protein
LLDFQVPMSSSRVIVLNPAANVPINDPARTTNLNRGEIQLYSRGALRCWATHETTSGFDLKDNKLNDGGHEAR